MNAHQNKARLTHHHAKCGCRFLIPLLLGEAERPCGRLGAGASLLTRTPKFARHLLHTHALRRVVITLGGQGAVLASDKGTWLAEAPRVKVASTVGSGDAFLAAMALAISSGASDAEALRQAVAAGTANAMTVGAGRFAIEDYERVSSEVKVTPAIR